MPKQSPIPNELDRPFYEAANEERLVLQFCSSCARWQYPPEPECRGCGDADRLAWREVESRRGTVYSYGVVHDTPVVLMQPDRPYNAAVIALDGAPEINMVSTLPGTAVGDVRIGSAVHLVFETTPTGQKVPEWAVGEPAGD